MNKTDALNTFGDESVIAHILERKQGVADKRKIGVIFEGGGMRAVYSSAAACGLEEMGLRNCFDIVYGSSAGSCVGGYFLTGQIEVGTSVFYDDLNNFKFIKPWRFSRMMDIDYLEKIFMLGRKKLDLEKLKAARPELKVYASDYKSGNPYCFTNRDDVEMLEAIVASCSAAGFCNKPIFVSGKVCLDGNIAKKLPIEEAISDGCTDVLIIPTVPRSHVETDKFIPNLLKHKLMGPLPKSYRKAYKRRARIYNNNLDVVFGRKEVGSGVRIYTIAPKYKTSEAEIRRSHLLKVAAMGRDNVKEVFRRGM